MLKKRLGYFTMGTGEAHERKGYSSQIPRKGQDSAREQAGKGHSFPLTAMVNRSRRCKDPEAKEHSAFREGCAGAWGEAEKKMR